MAEDRDEQLCRHNCELHVFVMSENQAVRGVAGLQQQNMDSASVGTATPVTVTPRRNSRCCSRWQGHVNKRQVLGIAMLIVVDLIWVGSAGLTRYLFRNESYDKPLFTVYFKTSLFTIYLVPFLFWRPWQRLCCISCEWKKRRTEYDEENQNVSSENTLPQRKDPPLSSNVNSTSGCTNDLLSSSDSTSTPGVYKLPMLGPSQYAPLHCRSDECELPLSLTLPPDSSSTPSPHLTLSNTYAKRKRLSRVRFCRTVEVKHVPSTGTETNEQPSPNQPVKLLVVRQVTLLALIFGFLWFVSDYLYAKALDVQSVAAVNTLSSLSGVFVLVLAALPLPTVAIKDRFTLTKLLIIIISVGGAIMVGLSPSSDKTRGINIGALYAVGGAGLYAIYLVMISKVIPNPDSLEIPMFFGFVGIIMSILLLPVLAFWDYIEWEKFELPPNSMVWTLLLINGFVGTVLSELLWLWGCLLTSSLVGTLSLSLVTPLSITYSIVVGETHISALFVVGAILIVLSFIFVAVIEHWSGWDPMWVVMKRFFLMARDYRSHKEFHRLSNESQCLLNEGDKCRLPSPYYDGGDFVINYH